MVAREQATATVVRVSTWPLSMVRTEFISLWRGELSGRHFPKRE